MPNRISATAEFDPSPMTMPRTARFILQSCFATYKMDGMYAPADVTPDIHNHQFTVLFLRYRRRLEVASR